MSLDPANPIPKTVTSLQRQVSAITKHGVTAGATAFTVLGALAFLPADQVSAAIIKLQVIGDDINKLTADVGGLVVFLGPGVVLLMGKMAAARASVTGALKTITAAPAKEAKIEGVIVTTPAVAAAVPSAKVVPSS
jgi:hypothetical protein